MLVKIFARTIENNLWKLKAIRMLFWMHFFGAVLVPFYTQWGGLKLSQVLFLNSWFMFWAFALEIPTGTVADFLGRKASLIAGSIVAACAALIYVSCPKFEVFLLAEFVLAVAYTLHSGADEAMAYDSLKAKGRESESKSFFSALESFKLGGIVIAAIIGGFIAAGFGVDAPMRAYAIPACLAFLMAFTLKETKPTGPATARKKYLTILKEGILFFSRHKVLLLLSFELALTNAFAWGIIWLFQPLLAQAGLPIKYFGFVHAASALGQIVLLANIEKVEAKLRSKRDLLLWMSGLSGAAFLLLARAQNPVVVIIAIVCAFTFSLSRVPIFSSYMNKYIPSDKRATVLSITSMTRTFSIVLINPVIGLLADWSLNYTMAILGFLILLATALSRIEEHHLID